MTDEELKALVAENSRAIREMRAEGELQRAESEKQRAESEERRAESEKRRAESEKRWAESERRWEESRQESERIWQEVLASRRDADRLIGGFDRRLGNLGNALGLYTEAFFHPSLKRILIERFGMTAVISPQLVWLDGKDYEIDMVGHAGEENDEVYLVEVKSQLREDGIQQILDHLRWFPRAFPEHRGKKLFGILAAVRVPENLEIQALKAGLYMAKIKDDVCEISTPDDFVPRAFGLRQLGGE